MNEEDPEKRREREFDAITFVLAGVLSAILLGAISYGIVNSSHRAASTVPALNASTQVPSPALPPVTTTGSH